MQARENGKSTSLFPNCLQEEMLNTNRSAMGPGSQQRRPRGQSDVYAMRSS